MSKIYARMSCGACGCTNFTVFGHAETTSALVLRCNDCGSTTVITVDRPLMKYQWGKNSEGILCVFPDETLAIVDESEDPHVEKH